MKITRNTLRLALSMALITSVGYVIAFPIFLGLVLIEIHDTSVTNSAGVGVIFVLTLPTFLLLRWLKKKPHFRDRLTLTQDEQKLFFSVGWSVAGLLFFTFIFNLRWFYTHDTVSMICGLIALWALIFGTLSSIDSAKVPKDTALKR